MKVSEFDAEVDSDCINNSDGVDENESIIHAFGLRTEAVSIGYKDDNDVKLTSFDIKPRQMVILIVKSVIGKTTLLRAIMGFLKPSSWELYSYSEVGSKMKCGMKSKKLISYEPHGNTLMFGTIADNLWMGKRDATTEVMKDVLRITNSLDFVESLPNGIDTQIGEKARRFQKDKRSVAQ